MSKKLNSVKVYEIPFHEDPTTRAFRVIFHFGELRIEENSVIITDAQEASVEFQRNSNTKETIDCLLSLVNLLKDSIV